MCVYGYIEWLWFVAVCCGIYNESCMGDTNCVWELVSMCVCVELGVVVALGDITGRKVERVWCCWFGKCLSFRTSRPVSPD